MRDPAGQGADGLHLLGLLQLGLQLLALGNVPETDEPVALSPDFKRHAAGLHGYGMDGRALDLDLTQKSNLTIRQVFQQLPHHIGLLRGKKLRQRR